VCMGTACYVKGAEKVINSILEKLKIKSGETTADGKVSLLTARCIGACGIAPAVTYDGQVAAKQTPEMALEKLNQWK
jgi:bidirectional [NiFe] hydrogenase diaphorase subunit